MYNVLLTGGLGYIGSHIAIELLNSNHEYNVIIIDNLSNSNIDKLEIIKIIFKIQHIFIFLKWIY